MHRLFLPLVIDIDLIDRDEPQRSEPVRFTSRGERHDPRLIAKLSAKNARRKRHRGRR